jgi:YegS/Rv2252/BmrU family lipid kinase
VTTVVVVNPAAAGGLVGRDLARLERVVRAHAGACDVAVSRGPGGAAALAEEAARGGATRVVSLGGDGTHNEVLNGLMRGAREPARVELGILPAGTGSDFCRVLEHGRSFERGARALRDAPGVPVDVGSVRFTTDAGDEATRYFLNIASCGVSGLVDRLVNGSSKRLGGTVTFFVAALRALRRYRPARVSLAIDGLDQGEIELNTLAVCNGRYAGGGMLFAPDARLADGALDVVAIEHAPLARTLTLTPRIYRGTHGGSPLVRAFRGRVVRVAPLRGEPPLLDIDGEVPGRAPAEFRVHPRAVRLVGPRDECV